MRPAPRQGTKLALLVALAALGVAALRGRIARFEVAEASMEPALRSGDYVVAVLTGKLGRGDIVAYPDPARPAQVLIKRVIGLQEETVTIAGGQVAIDGALLAEPWADGPTHPDGEWTTPRDTVFTIGDSRRLSAGDSRATGPVQTAGMYKVVWRYWPLGSIGRL